MGRCQGISLHLDLTEPGKLVKVRMQAVELVHWGAGLGCLDKRYTSI